MQILWIKVCRIGIFLAVLALILLAISLGPPPDAIPAYDGDVFLYVGRQMLHGDAPYRDVWDHKGPLLYAINVLGLWLGGDNIWGIWVLRALLLAVTAYLCWRLLARAFNNVAAAYSVVVLLLALIYVIGAGNFTEEYTLPLQFTALTLLWLAVNGRHTFLAYAGLGATLAAILLLRPNNSGTPLIVLAVLFVDQLYRRQWRNGVRLALLTLAGAVLVLAPVVLYLAAKGALGAMYTQFVAFNLAYANPPWSLRLITMGGLLSGIQPLLFNILLLSAWVLLLLHLFRMQNPSRAQQLLLVAVAIDLPLQMFLTSLSGRMSRHYVMLWLPAGALLFGWLMAHTQQIAGSRRDVATVIMFSLLVLTFASLPKEYREIEEELRHTVPPMTVVQELQKYQADFPHLVMWGSATGIHVVTRWPTPSRFVYQNGLIQDSPYAPAWGDEFMNSIASARPLIVDTSATNPRVPPIETKAYQSWQNDFQRWSYYEPFRSYRLDYVIEITTFIRKHYQPGETLENGWQLWIPRTETAGTGSATQYQSAHPMLFIPC